MPHVVHCRLSGIPPLHRHNNDLQISVTSEVIQQVSASVSFHEHV